MKFSFEDSIGFVINRAALRLKNELSRAFREHGHNLTPEHWAVLNCLWEEDGQTQIEIADRLVKDKANLTRILNVMSRNKLIERRTHESDGRSYRIFLTKKGRSLKGKLIPIAHNVLERAAKGLSQSDQKKIKALMDRVVKNLG